MVKEVIRTYPSDANGLGTELLMAMTSSWKWMVAKKRKPKDLESGGGRTGSN